MSTLFNSMQHLSVNSESVFITAKNGHVSLDWTTGMTDLQRELFLNKAEKLLKTARALLMIEGELALEHQEHDLRYIGLNADAEIDAARKGLTY